jgi:hypothetical protein
LLCKQEAPRFAYIAPFFNQAKDAAWEYLKRYGMVYPGTEANETELRVDFPNGGRVRLYGADNPDRLRGIYLDGVVLDEYAQMRPRLWSEIIRPALSDRIGWGAFIGTPMGRNAFWEIYKDAKERPDEWYSFLLKAGETGIVPAHELEANRRDMSEEQFAQEFECSFEAAIVGSYYGKLISQAEADKRLTDVPYDPSALVTTAWDLGKKDSTSIWFAQRVGLQWRILDYYEASAVDLAHYAAMLRAKPYRYYEHILPHDARQDRIGMPDTIEGQLKGLGVRPTRVLDNIDIAPGIEAVRRLIPQCWFDKTRCDRGLETLRHYRREWNEEMKTFKDHPIHDWASHGADAFRYLAVGLRPPKEKRESSAGESAGSWLGA